MRLPSRPAGHPRRTAPLYSDVKAGPLTPRATSNTCGGGVDGRRGYARAGRWARPGRPRGWEAGHCGGWGAWARRAGPTDCRRPGAAALGVAGTAAAAVALGALASRALRSPTPAAVK